MQTVGDLARGNTVVSHLTHFAIPDIKAKDTHVCHYDLGAQPETAIA